MDRLNDYDEEKIGKRILKTAGYNLVIGLISVSDSSNKTGVIQNYHNYQSHNTLIEADNKTNELNVES